MREDISDSPSVSVPFVGGVTELGARVQEFDRPITPVIAPAVRRMSVERMNGKAAADSDVNSGTDFWIQLPAAHTHV